MMEHGETLTLQAEGFLSVEERLRLELQHYRMQTMRLQRLNGLHAALAISTGLAAMVDALSLWLGEYVVHDMLAFLQEGNGRKHFCCSAHGPLRRLLQSMATQAMHQHWEVPNHSWSADGYCAIGWRFPMGGDWGRIIVLRPEGWVEAGEARVLDETLTLVADALQRALEYEEILLQSRRDHLTGLENRRAFEERIDGLMEQARRHGHSLTLIAMDLDHFKQVNDLLGHAAGDTVLRQVAGALRRQVRGCDLLARSGGDEFLLVLVESDLLAAQHLAARILRAVEGLDICAGSARLGLSMGIVQWSPEMSLASWLERADEILYQAKASGRGRVTH